MLEIPKKLSACPRRSPIDFAGQYRKNCLRCKVSGLCSTTRNRRGKLSGSSLSQKNRLRPNLCLQSIEEVVFFYQNFLRWLVFLVFDASWKIFWAFYFLPICSPFCLCWSTLQVNSGFWECSHDRCILKCSHALVLLVSLIFESAEVSGYFFIERSEVVFES